MVQRRFNPRAAFLGPFFGLNTTTDASELPPQYASVCRNIILSDGRIRPRAPWLNLAAATEPNALVQGMYYWVKVNTPFVIAKIGFNLYRFNVRGSLTAPPILLGQLANDTFADMVRFGDFLYILDGSDRLTKTDGTIQGTLQMGIDPPHPSVIISLSTIGGGPPGIGATVQYKITWYDRDHNVESNPALITAFNDFTITASSSEVVAIGYDARGGRFPSRQGITHMRIYRKNLLLLQTGFRLIAEIAVPSLIGAHVDSIRGDTTANENSDAVLSNLSDGPFAPALNKVPTLWSAGAVYNGRMFAAKIGAANEGRVYYSRKLFPDNEDETSLDVGGDTDDRIRGMVVVGDQLVIGKSRAIWILSGEVIAATNLDIATGTAPLDPSHRVYRTHANIGPTGSMGNSMTVAGEPALVYMVTDAGLVTFDGANTKVVSDAISEVWRLFSVTNRDRVRTAFSFGDDSLNGILYMAVSQSFRELPTQCLAYHYRINRGDGVGVWSEIDDGGVLINGTPFKVSCVTSVAGPGIQTDRFTKLGTGPVFGSTAKTVHVSTGDEPDALMPDFEWLSGSMPLARGMRAHVYWVKFFLNRSQAVNGNAPVVRLSVLTDQLERASASPRVDTIDVDTSQRDTVLLPIRRHARTVRIRIERGPGWTKGWDPHLGVLGWQPDTELVGQR